MHVLAAVRPLLPVSPGSTGTNEAAAAATAEPTSDQRRPQPTGRRGEETDTGEYGGRRGGVVHAPCVLAVSSLGSRVESHLCLRGAARWWQTDSIRQQQQPHRTALTHIDLHVHVLSSTVYSRRASTTRASTPLHLRPHRTETEPPADRLAGPIITTGAPQKRTLESSA